MSGNRLTATATDLPLSTADLPLSPAPVALPAVVTEVLVPRKEERSSTTIFQGTRSGIATTLCIFAADVTMLLAAMGTGHLLSSALLGTSLAGEWIPARVFALFLAMQLLGLGARGLHSPLTNSSVAALARTVSVILCVTFLLTLSLLAAAQPWPLIISVLVTGGLATVAVPAGRSLVKALFGNANWWGRRVFVIGSDRRAASLFSSLLRQPQRGLRPVGFVDDLETLDPELDPAFYLGPPEALRELGITLHVNAAVIVKTGDDAETQRLFCREETGIRDWLIMSSLDGYPSLWGTAVEVAGLPAIWARNRLLSPWSRRLKRGADLAITMISLLAGLPLIAAIMVLIRLGSAGPIFYCHERIGRHGRRFQAWKFRTMVVNADQVLEDCFAADPLLRAEWEASHKLKRDPRITWIGMLLRKTSLDELPQLWNVLRGEMSLVGPRPIVEKEIDKYADQYEYYVEVLPGITGFWQVSGRNNTTYQERVALDAYYVKNWSLWLDLYILISTVRVILFREGAY